MEKITLTTPDGFALDAHYYPGTNGIGIVFCHGLGWYKEGEKPFVKAAEELGEKGYATLLFDFRANGKSSGDSVEDFTISSQLTDIDAAVTFLQKNGATTIYLAGASFGGGAVCLYAEKHQESIKKLLLENPTLEYERSIKKHFFPRLDILEKQGYIEVHKEKYKVGKKLYRELQEFNPYQSLEKYHNDLLIIHGDSDHIIAHQDVISQFEKLSNPKKKFSLIIGADHGFHEEPYTTQAAENIINFFTS